MHDHDDDAFDAADEGPVEVSAEEAERLFLEACQAAKDAGF
jgi:hypothetical protein